MNQAILKNKFHIYFLSIAFVFISLFIRGQDQSRIDSLQSALSGSQEMERFEILSFLAAETKYINPDQSRNYAQEALGIAAHLYEQIPSKKYQKAIAEAQKHIAVSYSIQGNNEQALHHGNLASEIFKSIGDPKDLTEIYNSLGIIHDQMGETNQALDYYRQAEISGKQWGDLDRLSGVYNNMGYVYQTKGEYKTALKYYNQSLKLAQQSDSKEGIGYACFNLAIVNDYLGEFEESLRLFYLSLDIREDLK